MIITNSRLSSILWNGADHILRLYILALRITRRNLQSTKTHMSQHMYCSQTCATTLIVSRWFIPPIFLNTLIVSFNNNWCNRACWLLRATWKFDLLYVTSDMRHSKNSRKNKRENFQASCAFYIRCEEIAMYIFAPLTSASSSGVLLWLVLKIPN